MPGTCARGREVVQVLQIQDMPEVQTFLTGVLVGDDMQSLNMVFILDDVWGTSLNGH
jgi:hypothetical protein